MAARIHQSLEWFGDFRCLFAHVRAYAIRPYTCSPNFWAGRCISLRIRSRGGRMRYAPTLVRLIFGRGGVFRCAFAHVRAYAIRPYTCSLNRWAGRRFSLLVRSRQGVCDTPLHLFAIFLGGAVYFVACSPSSGRMRYAPTPVRLIFGRGGDFLCLFAHVRAYAIRPYSFWRNLWRASNNCGRYFLPEIFYASSYRYFLPAKKFRLVVPVLFTYKKFRLVIPVVFGVAFCIGSSYR